jgi:MtaA/CmuA family methyltransferase
MNGRERVLALLDGRPVDRLPALPITMMLAADEIGAAYREYVSDYRVLAEAQVQTATRFDFDHVSAISDPCREAADLGAEIQLFDAQPPAIVEARARLRDKRELRRLQVPDPLGGGRMHDRVKGIERLARDVGGRKLIEGWVEGPCAEAADLRGIHALMLDLSDDPGFVRELLEFTLEVALSFAGAQLDAGAELIGVGDAAASLVGPRLYGELVFPYQQRLVDGLHRRGARVRLHVCGRTRRLLPWLGRLGVEILDLDWMVPLADARRLAGPRQVLLGNVDPVAVVRNGTPEDVTRELDRCHRAAGARYIVGAGCELVRDSPRANVRALVDYARTHRPDAGLRPRPARRGEPEPRPEEVRP